MLIMTATILLGFSLPNQARNIQAEPAKPDDTLLTEEGSQPTVVATAATMSTVPVVPAIAAAVESSKWAVIAEKPTRPASLASQEHIRTVLGGISSGTWLTDADDSVDPATTPHVADFFGALHGIGFPNIRTYLEGKRSPWAPPGPWAPMIAWRALNSEPGESEPIARVRCMGLTPQAVAKRADRYRDIISSYSDRYGVSPHLVMAVITKESCFNNKALSRVGAQGLMQLMPDTARWLKVKDSRDPAQNVRGGIRYLSQLKEEFESLELALAAYNAGPGNVRRYNGVPPFAETQAYVVEVQEHYRRYKAAHRHLNPIETHFEQASNTAIGP